MEPQDFKHSGNKPPKHPFTVPNGYFDNLPMQIQQRVQQKQKERFIFQPWLTPKFRLSAVMGILLMVAASVWFVLHNQQSEIMQYPQVSVAQLTDQEITQFLTSEEAVLETGDLAILTSLEEPIDQTMPAYNLQDLEEEISTDEIEEYYYL